MTNKPSYAVIVSTRNGASTIRKTLNSILKQTLSAVKICVVDDGSTDETARILTEFDAKPGVRTVRRSTQCYDIRRVPANFNLAHVSLGRERTFDYLMISGDDCVYPTDYVNSIVSRMESDSATVVASGRPRTGSDILEEHSPSGSGRLIRYAFWCSVGGAYPVRVGWETWLLYRALQQGFKTELYVDLIYDHLRPRGSMHQFTYWGSAMYCLGYHPLYALGRIAKSLAKTEVAPNGCVSMFGGYLMGLFGSSDAFVSAFEPSLRNFVKSSQAHRITGIVSTAVGRLSRRGHR